MPPVSRSPPSERRAIHGPQSALARTLSDRRGRFWRSRRLACRAVVGFVVGVANALDGGSADWAGLLVAAMDRHPVFERAHLLWELRSRIRAQLLDPPSRGRSRGVVQSRDFRVAQFSRQLERGELRGVQDLI